MASASQQRRRRRRRQRQRQRPRQRQRQRQRQRRRQWRDWSGLPSDVVDEIKSYLSSNGDRVRFAAVSSSWRRSSMKPPPPPPSHTPWLMFPRPQRGKYKKDDDDDKDRSSSFYSFSERKLYHIQILPQIQWYERVAGSGKGWIITLNILNGNLRLLDFLAASTTTLPSANIFSCRGENGKLKHPISELEFLYSCVRKAVFFPSASLVFVIHNFVPCGLAFARLGDKSWNNFDSYCNCIRDMAPCLGEKGKWCSFTDIVFHKGHFYAMAPPGWILTLDLSSTTPRCTCLHLKPPPSIYITNNREKSKSVETYYLVESPDGTELMQVFRLEPYKRSSYLMDPEFIVFKCKLNNDKEEQEAKWEEVKSLDGWVLFLGDKNLSFALTTRDFPELTPNSIYFIHINTVDYAEGDGVEMGVYHLESRTIEPLLEYLPAHISWPMPIWMPHSECFPVVSQITKVEDITKRTKVKFGDKTAPVEIDKVPYRFSVEMKHRWMKKYPHLLVGRR